MHIHVGILAAHHLALSHCSGLRSWYGTIIPHQEQKSSDFEEFFENLSGARGYDPTPSASLGVPRAHGGTTLPSVMASVIFAPELQMSSLKLAWCAKSASVAKPHENKKNRGTNIVPRFCHLVPRRGFEPRIRSTIIVDISSFPNFPSVISFVILS